MRIIFTKNAELINMAKEKGEQMINLNHFAFNNINISDSKATSITELEIPKKSQISKYDIMVLITQLGVPAHIKGYNYLIFALDELLHNPKFDETGLTKCVYPNIAAHFGTTSMRVERGIRHAIATACNRGNLSLFEKIFGYSINESTCKPTNSEFLYGIKAYLERTLYKD